VVDGSWYLTAAACVRTDAYDRLVAIGDRTWTNYEVLVPITIHSVDPAGYTPTSGCPVVGIFFRWTGHTDDPVSGWQPRAVGTRAVCSACTRTMRRQRGERLEFWQHAADESGKTLPLGVTHMFRMSVETRPQGVVYGLKVWINPARAGTWDLTYVDNKASRATGRSFSSRTMSMPRSGSQSGSSGRSASGPAFRFFGEQLNLTTVRLVWHTLSETENYGFRGERSPRAPENFSLLAAASSRDMETTVVPQEYAYVDSGVGAGVWYYRLRQIDLDGTVHFQTRSAWISEV